MVLPAFQADKPRSSSVPGMVLSSKIARNAPTAIPVLPSVFKMLASQIKFSENTSGWAIKYSGTLNPIKNENPRMNRFLAEFKLIN